MRTLKRLPLLVALLALMFAPLVAGPARAADPAIAPIDAFDSTLLSVMKDGKSLGPKGRYQRLAPVVHRTFDLPTMTKFAVGPAWASFTPAQQQATIEAFTRLSIASYAHNFADYSGQRFEIDPNVQTRGPDKIVQTHMYRPNDSPVNLTYRMRESGGTWKIIDIYFGSISQLTTRRSDFAAPIASGGAAGLLSHLNSLVDNLMK
ncbi:MAG: ABC transporter substrate-binding protein [Caulobacteraceae bacterium]|nr:ABC transporter substrate-binding protein [Caulobacteraceae bacterium]